jgi:hypothetical protein
MEDNILQPENSMTLEEIRKEEEFINTIKMEPILEKISIEEEETVVKERKIMKITDYFLIALIFVLVAVFIYIVLTVK